MNSQSIIELLLTPTLSHSSPHCPWLPGASSKLSLWVFLECVSLAEVSEIPQLSLNFMKCIPRHLWLVKFLCGDVGIVQEINDIMKVRISFKLRIAIGL